MSKKEQKSFVDLSPSDVTKKVCAEYRRQINPFVVAYTEKKEGDNPLKETLPTDFISVSASSLPTDEVKGEEKSFRETIGDRDYEQFNPTFTSEVCAALAKSGCRHCYTTGLQHFSVPERAKWSEACWCVKNHLDKLEKEVEGSKKVILGY